MTSFCYSCAASSLVFVIQFFSVLINHISHFYSHWQSFWRWLLLADFCFRLHADRFHFKQFLFLAFGRIFFLRWLLMASFCYSGVACSLVFVIQFFFCTNKSYKSFLFPLTIIPMVTFSLTNHISDSFFSHWWSSQRWLLLFVTHWSSC